MFDRKRLHIKSLAERKSKTFYYPVTPYPYGLDDKERIFVDEMVGLKGEDPAVVSQVEP